MGAPLLLARAAQAVAGLGHIGTARAVLADFEFERTMGRTLLVREPVGVCGMITPWNWPLNQIACKVAPALATGCTMVLKPSEVAPLNAIMFAEILDEAGGPTGGCNLGNGRGLERWARPSPHPRSPTPSFPRRTRAGRAGALLQARGTGKADGLEAGYYVRPTVFSHVSNDMTIAREEIFGPVLVLIGYEDDDVAVGIANDSLYGLSGYISGDSDRARAIARRIRTGNIHLNGAGPDFNAPFGGYRRSGNGREWGALGFDEYPETKSLIGYDA